MEEEQAAGSGLGVTAEKRQSGGGEKKATPSSGGSSFPLVIRLRIKDMPPPEDPMEDEEEAGSGFREDMTSEYDPMEEEEVEAGSGFREDMTPEEWNAASAYLSALFEDYKVYRDMSEDDVEEEYRRAGKLHMYDPETELHKRCARVAKRHPPPDGFEPKLKEYFKLIEDED
jgi:hypothetical protein